MSSQPVAKQPYHHGSLQEAALAAAIRRMQGSVAELPTLRDLAGEIGVTHRALYRHFADKEALKLAVASRGFALLADSMEAAAPLSPRAVMKAYVRFAFAEPHLYRLMFALGSRELMQDPQSRRVLAIVRGAFAMDAPDASEDDIRDRVVSAWGLAHGLYELWRVGALTVTDPAQAAPYIMSRLAASALV